MNVRESVRAHVRQALQDAGDSRPLRDDDALFSSGRLDSLALTQLVLFLEAQFQLDFGALDFSAELLDSVEVIEALVQPKVS